MLNNRTQVFPLANQAFWTDFSLVALTQEVNLNTLLPVVSKYELRWFNAFYQLCNINKIKNSHNNNFLIE